MLFDVHNPNADPMLYSTMYNIYILEYTILPVLAETLPSAPPHKKHRLQTLLWS